MLYPTVSIIIPTFNEEKNIKKCLDSIFSQNYPKNKLEVLIVDNYSTDKTVLVAKEYKVKVLFNKIKHGEISKMIGFKASTSEFAFYLDADIELRGKDWIKRMLKPLIEDKTIIGAFTRYYSKKSSPAIERYLNFDPLQRDSLYQYFSPKLDEVITGSKSGYFVCEYSLKKIPPAGLCVYRRESLLSNVKNYDMFLELDFLVVLTKNNLNKFAYVPAAGLYHNHVKSFFELLKKRKYNLQKVYLGRKKRLYKWFDLKTKDGLLKIIFWVLMANLVLPSLIVGIYKTIKYRDFAGLYEPLINLVLTDYLIFLFLINKQGRELIQNEKVKLQ